MSQGPYPPGYEPADGAPRPPQDGFPEVPTNRATARIPQPPPWAQPQSAQPAPGSYGTGQPYGSSDQPYGAPAQPGYDNPPGSFGSAPAPPPGRVSGSASVPGAPPTSGAGYGQPAFGSSPGTYGSPASPGTYGTPAASGSYGQPAAGSYAPPYAGPEPSRFAGLRYDDGSAGPPPPTKSKRGLIIGIVVVAIVILGLVGAGVTWALSRSSDTASFAVNSCVQKSDEKAIAVSCSATGAYQIVSKVDTVDKCPDRNQPYVVLQQSGKPDQVLCLKPAH